MRISSLDVMVYGKCHDNNSVKSGIAGGNRCILLCYLGIIL